MANTTALEISLSEQALHFLRERVVRGEFPSAEAAICQIVEDARLDAEELTQFERDEVIPAYQEWLANPSSTFSIDDVRRNLAAVVLEQAKAG